MSARDHSTPEVGRDSVEVRLALLEERHETLLEKIGELREQIASDVRQIISAQLQGMVPRVICDDKHAAASWSERLKRWTVVLGFVSGLGAAGLVVVGGARLITRLSEAVDTRQTVVQPVLVQVPPADASVYQPAPVKIVGAIKRR